MSAATANGSNGYAQEPVASSTAHKGKLATIDLSEYDPEQSKLMDERCIVVDENDTAIGALDKKTCRWPRVVMVFKS
jgi:isopentenyl-diphosphate delta-isomerase